MAMSYLLQLLHARIVDHNLAGSTLPPQSRFLQEERETCAWRCTIPRRKKVSCETGDVSLLMRHIFFPLLVLSTVPYIGGGRSEALPVKNWTL